MSFLSILLLSAIMIFSESLIDFIDDVKGWKYLWIVVTSIFICGGKHNV